jgi:hypothetical protein
MEYAVSEKIPANSKIEWVVSEKFPVKERSIIMAPFPSGNNNPIPFLTSPLKGEGGDQPASALIRPAGEILVFGGPDVHDLAHDGKLADVVGVVIGG